MSNRQIPYLDDLLHGVRFGKFVSVGAIGAAFDITTLIVLTELVELHWAIANAISIEVAILVMFTVNENWTFAGEADEERDSLPRRLLRSHMVRAVGSSFQYLLFATVLFLVTVDLSLLGIDLWVVLVKGGSIGIAMLVNYVFESLFTWRVHES